MVDAWTAPVPTSSEYPRQATNGVDALVDRIDRSMNELREMRNNLLSTAGIKVTPEGLTVERSLDVNGELLVTGATRIEGTLSLPAGIIDNEALANPVTFASNFGDSEGFGTPASAWLEVASTTIVIPAGFAKLQFTSFGMVNGTNSTGSTQNMYVRIKRTVDGAGNYTSQQGQTALPAGFQGIANCFYLWNETVAPGEAHRFAVEVWTSAAFAPTTFNYSAVDVQALFGR